KKLKFLIPTPTPLRSIFPEPTPIDPTPLREPTLPRDERKGKGIATEEEPMKHLLPLIEQADLKAEKEESKKALLKIINPASIQAQAAKMVEYEAKRAKMLAEYNHYITYRADKRPITKINYRIDKVSKDATMRIERDNQPLSLESDSSSRVVGSRGLVITEPESGIFYYNGNYDLVFQRENELHLATTAQLIRQLSYIQRTSLEAEEIIKKIEFTMKARNDVEHARKIIRDNLDEGRM
ncbi:hypothetical protein Tco_1560380, partial [Tanacetum coccineum]